MTEAPLAKRGAVFRRCVFFGQVWRKNVPFRFAVDRFLERQV
jgi:hypothetical protein